MKKNLLSILLLLHTICYANLPMRPQDLRQNLQCKVFNLSKFKEYQFFILKIDKDHPYSIVNRYHMDGTPYPYYQNDTSKNDMSGVMPYTSGDEIIATKSGEYTEIVFFGKNTATGEYTYDIGLLDAYKFGMRQLDHGLNIFIDSITKVYDYRYKDKNGETVPVEKIGYHHELHYTEKADTTSQKNKIDLFISNNGNNVKSNTTFLVVFSLIGTLLLTVLFFIRKHQLNKI